MIDLKHLFSIYPIRRCILRHCAGSTLMALVQCRITRFTLHEREECMSAISPKAILFGTDIDKDMTSTDIDIIHSIEDGKIGLWGKHLAYFTYAPDLPAMVHLNLTVSDNSSVSYMDIYNNLVCRHSYSRLPDTFGFITLSRSLEKASTLRLYIRCQLAMDEIIGYVTAVYGESIPTCIYHRKGHTLCITNHHGIAPIPMVNKIYGDMPPDILYDMRCPIPGANAYGWHYWMNENTVDHDAFQQADPDVSDDLLPWYNAYILTSKLLL